MQLCLFCALASFSYCETRHTKIHSRKCRTTGRFSLVQLFAMDCIWARSRLNGARSLTLPRAAGRTRQIASHLQPVTSRDMTRQSRCEQPSSRALISGRMAEGFSATLLPSGNIQAQSAAISWGWRSSCPRSSASYADSRASISCSALRLLIISSR